MLLANTLTPLLYTLYLLGQSPFPSSTTSASKSYLKRFLVKLPVLIVICVGLFVTIYFLNNDFYVAWENRGLDIMHVLLILSTLITSLVIVYRGLFRGSFGILLQESVGALETEFQSLLPNQNVQLAKFRNVFLIKCFAMLITYFVLVFAMVMSRIKSEYSHTSVMIVLAFCNDLCALQVVLFVDLIKFFLKTITDAFRDIDGQKAGCARVSFTRTELLASTKKCHSSIYKTVDKINEHFGPFLLSYMVQQFLVISYYIFWILLHKFSIGFWSSLDNCFVLLCALLSLFFVSNSCHNICIEIQKIGSFLYEDEYLSTEEGQRFLTQILNQPIKITAMEFYKLDRSFFAALTIGGMTSGIMLVQFQNN